MPLPLRTWGGPLTQEFIQQLCGGGRARPALSHLGARSRRGPGLGWWAPPGTHCLSLDPPGRFQPEHTSHTHLGSGCFPLEVLSFSPGIPLTGGWEGLATWGGLSHGTVGATQGPPEAWPSALLCCPSSQILRLKASQEGVSSSASRAAGRGCRWSPGHAHSRRMAHAFLGHSESPGLPGHWQPWVGLHLPGSPLPVLTWLHRTQAWPRNGFLTGFHLCRPSKCTPVGIQETSSS